MSIDYDELGKQRERIEAIFEANDSEYSKFDRIENKLSRRPDIHAFLLLDSLDTNGKHRIVDYAGHDEIGLSFTVSEYHKLTEEIIIDLIRCGVNWGSGGYFVMFV